MSDEMSAVMGASSMIRTMADGTFRIQIDVEPRFAQQAFALFGAPGTPVALARITNEAAVEQDRAAQREPEKPKGGMLAKEAAMLCELPTFREFCEEQDADGAADWIRFTCNVASRADLDNSESAAALFKSKVRGPYMKWMQSRGAA